MARIAECACGSLKVKVDAEPIIVAACSCTDCQKRTGSVFGVSAYFPKESVQIVSGISKIIVSTRDSGQKGERHFCPECGSSIFWDGEFFPDFRGVAVGCFADPSFPPPQLAVYNRSRHPWVSFPLGIKSYETSSPDASASLMSGTPTTAKSSP
jgi:hypothetical protein